MSAAETNATIIPNNSGPAEIARKILAPSVYILNIDAAESVASPSKKLNLAASAGLRPTAYPPIIVIIERLVPGHIAMHCKKPIISASLTLISLILRYALEGYECLELYLF